MSVGSRSESCNVLSNDHGCTQNCDFCVLVGKTNFTDHHPPDAINGLEIPFWPVNCTSATVSYAKTSSVSIPSHHRPAIAMIRLGSDSI